MSFTEQKQAVQNHINTKLEQHIGQLANHAKRLKQAMQYALLIGGKRMRPALVYATGESLALAKADLDVPAMAIECVHAYSLIHDDLPAMDDDDMRRGKPTCHIAFDQATAILAGDALQTMAFEILADQPLSSAAEPTRVRLLSILAKAAGYAGMCGGQAMDLAATGSQIDEAQLQSLHQKKTGALISASVKMAYSLATDLDPRVKREFDNFADAIGLAFQVQDDILDVTSETEILGKPQGSDQALQKSTYPELLGLDGACNYLQQLQQQALQALLALPYNTRALQALTNYNLQRRH